MIAHTRHHRANGKPSAWQIPLEARRAERAIVALALEEKDGDNSVTPLAIQYLNRLSDFFFVLARDLARKDGGQETLWKSRHTQSKTDI